MSPIKEDDDFMPATIGGEPTWGPATTSSSSPATAAAGGFHQFLQPNRDLQSNWEVDLARNLEEYLFKICSGEITAGHDHEFPQPSVNFAEAALLLQGSVQVYSRKVEYLYSLVLHALDFLSQKRQNENENTSIQPNEGEDSAVVDEENEVFLGLDDVPVDEKNYLDPSVDKGENARHVLHPPANLLVLEGDCLATNGDGSELDSYLLATCDFFEDFLLLDPCDAEAVHGLRAKAVGKEGVAQCRSSSMRPKTHCSSLLSPNPRSIGSGRKSSIGRNLNIDKTFENDSPIRLDKIHCSDSQNECDYPDHECDVGDQGIGCSYNRDESDDDDDPWKPLNPYEPGNLKIKPYRRVKSFGRRVVQHSKRNSLTSQFPIARLDSIISPELNKLFEVQKCHLQEKLHASKSPPLFEKLRRELSSGEQETLGGFDDMGDDHDNDHQAEYEAHDISPDLPDNDTCNMDAEVPLHDGKPRDTTFDVAEDFDHDNLDSVGSLEDLCRSHLDALLASIAESEKQTELAARVSTWQQGVECALEEEDKQPPFDIHIYGERILDSLSLGVGSSGRSMPFTDIVTGQTKQNVARTFSALLQLVNNGMVNLDRNTTGSELVCHTSENPFYVRLLNHDTKVEEHNNASARKRSKSVTREGYKKSDSKKSTLISPSRSSLRNGGLTVKLMKGSITRCTPNGKRRRRSARPTEPFDLQSAI